MTMHRERWREVERVFLELLDESPARRAELLRERSGTDGDLAAAVERLLAAHERSSGLTVAPGVEIAAPEERAGDGSRVGERLGSYELVERIGRGGMSTVYRARRTDGSFDRDVAVKVLRAPVEDGELRARFRAEQQILAGLEHPSIARLYDGGTTNDRALYLVLELVEGRPIDAYCDAHGCDLGERLRLFRRVCDAVAFAHQRLVVHRDLKPSNILVDEQGEVRLLDFGIAKLMRSESPLSTLTRSDFVPLTPGFASPEQLRGGQVTTASDVFSLGALLYLLTTGRAPFAGSLAERLKGLILDEPIPRPSDVAAESQAYATLSGELKGDLDAIVQKALRAVREDRYQTVQELAADLERARRGEPVGARQGNWMYLSGRWMRRNRTQLAAGLSLVLLTALWAWSARRQAQEIGRQRDLAQLEAAKATETSEFLVGLFESAAPLSAEDADVTAREVLNRGAERARRDLASQPDVQAEMLYNVGRALGRLRLSAEALPVLEEALALRRRERAGDEAVGEVLYQMAKTHFSLGQHAEGAEKAREAVALCRRASAQDPDCLGAGLQILGLNLSAIGEFEAARLALEEALALMEGAYGPRHEDTRTLLNSLGLIAFGRSDWEQAVDYFSRVYRGSETWETPPETADVGRNKNAWGSALVRLGRADEALRLHQEAFEALSEVYGPIHANVAASLTKKGVAQLALGDHLAAEESIGEALEIQQQLFPPGHPRISFAQTRLAEVWAAQGRLAEAEQLFAEGTEGMRRTVPRLVQRAEPLTAFGRFLMEQGRHAEAMELLVEAREVAGTLPPESEGMRAIVAAIEECGLALETSG
jgi:serine/threonine-protein kinase